MKNHINERSLWWLENFTDLRKNKCMSSFEGNWGLIIILKGGNILWISLEKYFLNFISKIIELKNDFLKRFKNFIPCILSLIKSSFYSNLRILLKISFNVNHSSLLPNIIPQPHYRRPLCFKMAKSRSKKSIRKKILVFTWISGWCLGWHGWIILTLSLFPSFSSQMDKLQSSLIEKY